MQNLKKKATELAQTAGLSNDKAKLCAQKFIKAIKKHRDIQRAEVERKVHSVDKTAGEIVIRMHETSSREVHEVLHDIVERYQKDPDKWTVATKIGNTSGGYTSYVCKPISEKPKKAKKSSSTGKTKKSRKSKDERTMEQLENLPKEELQEVIQQLEAQKDEDNMDI